ncbi:MAG TPA: TonB-dependent receptor, partial [Acidobacteriota bacterium]
MRGVVTDTDDQPLPGATVTISSDTLLGQKKITYTNETGLFRFPSLSIGTYSIEVSMDGYEPVQVEKADVGLYSTTTVPIQMKFATKTESITVIGETPLVDVSDSGFSTSYKNELLQEVPTQRNMTDLMQVAPGISPGIGDSQIDRMVAFGSNVQSNSWNIDGVDTSDPQSGFLQWSVNPDLIQEIQVIGVGAPAEYGNHLGGVFNVVTKKGGSQFHGGASLYYQNDSLTGTNVELDPANLPCGNECNSFHRIKYDNFSSQLGGPILKDTISFFGGFESFRDASKNPKENPAFAAIDKRDRYDMKVSGSLGEKNEVNGFFHYENWTAPWDPTLNYEPSALPNQAGSNPAWGGSWTSTISNNCLLELSYSGWRSNSSLASSTGSLKDPFIDFTPSTGGDRIYSGGILKPSDHATWKNQFKAKATSYAENFLKSEHEFRFGVQYSYASVLANNAIGPNGIFTYSLQGNLYRAYQDPFQYGAVNNDLGFFVDDTVNVNDKLTLNLGVRFDHNTGHMPEFEILTAGQPSVSSVGNFKKTGEQTSEVSVLNWNIISPRLGLIYQPRGDGHSIIQGSFGVYYDHNVSGNWNFPPPGLGTFATFGQNPDTGLFNIPHTSPITPEDVSINPDLKPPRTLQFSVGYEHQIGQSMAFGTQYVYKTTKDLIGWEI